jgi:hypothetical protein
MSASDGSLSHHRRLEHPGTWITLLEMRGVLRPEAFVQIRLFGERVSRIQALKI